MTLSGSDKEVGARNLRQKFLSYAVDLRPGVQGGGGGEVAPSSASASHGVILSDADKDWIFSEILQHPKLEAVKRICDGDSVADKNSVCRLAR